MDGVHREARRGKEKKTGNHWDRKGRAKTVCMCVCNRNTPPRARGCVGGRPMSHGPNPPAPMGARAQPGPPPLNTTRPAGGSVRTPTRGA